MAKVELKQPIVDEIKAQLDGAKSMVVVDYRGISVADVTELRKQCREAGVVYKVYKNTMVKRAVEGTEFEGVVKDLEGTNAFAISKEDATAPARIVANFIKKAKCCELKSGVVEGTSTMQQVLQQSQLSHQETNLSQNSWEAFSPQLQTLPA